MSPARLVLLLGLSHLALQPASAWAQAGADTVNATPDTLVRSTVPGLQVRFRGRGELGGDWTEFRPCNEAIQLSCEVGFLPRITPDLQFGLAASGSIFDRFVVDVDYEQAREFSAANTLNLYYQGQPGDVIDRIEVGDVSFDLPESRYLTQSIPAANLGIRATGGWGPLSFQTVFAQQQGDVERTEFQLSGIGGADGFVRRDTLVLDDADYVEGQFFFLMDPATLFGYPQIDVLALTPADAPPDQRPGAAPIQLYRFEPDPRARQQVEGYIQADAAAESNGDVVTESGWFRALSPEIDYVVHPSGLWVGVRRPLLPGELLAVTYISATGDTIGDYNPERVYTLGERPQLRLLRASNPNHQPGRPTWERELRNVYRVSAGTQVDPRTLDVHISVGELSGGQTFTRGASGEFSFLRLFGLDSQSPVDQIDESAVYRPADESVGDRPQVPGTYLVFPTLRPFAVPPPLPSLGLSADETLALLGEFANPAIYDEPDPLERRSAGLFRLNIEFTVRSEETLGTFSLGAFGIRSGSERLMLGNYRLRPGEDYLIDYDIGTVTLLDPRSLFARFPNRSLTATWEQKSLFEIAPTTIMGLGFDYALGERGKVSLLGMYQFERELVRRPQLGVESSAVWLGGVSADFSLPAGWLDRAVANLPVNAVRPSTLHVRGELAFSLPDPNTQRDVFLDDFDNSNDLSLPRFASQWRVGSAPTMRDGAEPVLPLSVDADDAASLVWQHTWRTVAVGPDTARVFEGFVPQEIDQQLTVIGNPQRESALLLSFGLESPGRGAPAELRWRSMTTALSATGLDLSRSEFIEFYAADGDSLTLIIDLGVVSEDALFVDEQGATAGVKPDGTPWGLNRLDQEADPARGEIWSDALDQQGVWGESCEDERGAVYLIGDPNAVCTRGNSREDSEDLDGDGNLDTLERFVRYVVPLDDSSPFLARSRTETGTGFRLFRVPLRSAAATNPGGLFTEADWRGVKHLRLTLTGSRASLLFLARPRIVGSRWVKRGLEGVLDGLSGDVRSGAGAVEVGTASRVTDGEAYTPPPGVLEQLDDPAVGLSGEGVEFAERSLRIAYDDVQPNSRAEVFQRFPQRPRNFFVYRQARLWAVARAGDWGAEQPNYVFLKVGSDAKNFYLFRSKLDGVSSPSGVQSFDWLPELEVDFEEWIRLRQQAEAFLIANPQAQTGEPLEFWSADSTYAVVLQDRARAPVLAAVRELSVGVLNEGGLPISGEVWFDELRLSRAVRTPGVASHVEVSLDGGGIFTTQLTFSSRNPFFRQLRDEPEYFDRSTFSLRSTLNLDRFAPASWGVQVPVSVTHTRTGDDPRFLGDSDLRADQLPGLRLPTDGSTRVGVSFRKSTPVEEGWYGPLLEGVEAAVGITTSDLTTVTTSRNVESFDARVSYRRDPTARTVPVLPGFVGSWIARVAPDAWVQALSDTRVRWTPERLSVSAAYQGDDSRIMRFDQILTQPADSLQLSTLAPRSALETRADVQFRPARTLSFGLDWIGGRDLLDPDEVVGDQAVQTLIAGERARLLGVDLGWETRRQLTTNLGFQPQIGEWLRGGFDVRTTYGSYRDANLVRLRAEPGDPNIALQRNVDGRRSLQGRVTLDPGRLAAAVDSATVERAWLRRALDAVQPLSLSWQNGINVRHNRAVIDPGLAYQMGWIGLDGYRFSAGDTAAFLADRSSWTASTGLTLPASLSLAVDYQRAVTSTFDIRSDRTRVDRTWPNVRVSFSDVPLPESFRPMFRRITISGGYVRRLTDRTFGGVSQQRQTLDEVRVPVDASVSWFGLLNTTYRGAYEDGEGVDPTGLTRRGGQLHSLALTSSFRPPWGLADRLIRPVSLALRGTYSRQDECRVVVGGNECVPFVDQLNRSLSLTFDSSVQSMDVGLEVSYVDRRSFVGLRNGSTQFQLLFFGQFQAEALLFAGDTPG